MAARDAEHARRRVRHKRNADAEQLALIHDHQLLRIGARGQLASQPRVGLSGRVHDFAAERGPDLHARALLTEERAVDGQNQRFAA